MHTIGSPGPQDSAIAIRCPDDRIGALLRDTALLVTSIASGGTVANAVAFRQHCTQLIDRFAQALSRHGYPEDVQREALIAQCGLLDEVALHHLPGESRAGWEVLPLQVERFAIHDAGRRVIDCIETHLRDTHEASSDADLLECYASILGMGFVGRYARDGEAKRVALIAALNARLQALRPVAQRPFSTDPAQRFSHRLHWFAPWIVAALAGAIAMLVWIKAGTAIDNQLAPISQAKIGRP